MNRKSKLLKRQKNIYSFYFLEKWIRGTYVYTKHCISCCFTIKNKFHYKKIRIKSSLNRVLCIQLEVIQFDIIKTENHFVILILTKCLLRTLILPKYYCVSTEIFSILVLMGIISYSVLSTMKLKQNKKGVFYHLH